MFFRNRFNAMLSGGRANERRIGKLRLRAVMAMVLIIGGFTGVIVSCILGKLSLGIGIGEIALVVLILTASDPLRLFEKTTGAGGQINRAEKPSGSNHKTIHFQ